MLELLIACDETPFRFDTGALRAAALALPGATFAAPGPRQSTVSDGTVYIPDHREGLPEAELHLLTGGAGVGVDVPDAEAGARLLAWLVGATPELPDDESVAVIHWRNDLYPLRSGMSAEQILADRRS